MLEYKISTSPRLPVRLLDSNTGSAVTGKINTDVTVTIRKSDGTTSTVASGNRTFTEVTTGAFSGAGYYELALTDVTLTNTSGVFTYAVSCAGCDTHIGVIKIVANEEVDTFGRIGAPVGASISADVASNLSAIAAVQTTVNTINTNTTGVASTLQDILDYHQGKWEVVTTGLDINKMVFYKADGVTVLKKFALQKADGTATFANPYKRIPL